MLSPKLRGRTAVPCGEAQLSAARLSAAETGRSVDDGDLVLVLEQRSDDDGDSIEFVHVQTVTNVPRAAGWMPWVKCMM